MTDGKNSDQLIESKEALFWASMNAENKVNLYITVNNCGFHENRLHKLLAGLVVDSPSMLKSYKACSDILHEDVQTGWSLLSILDLIMCCDLVLHHITNEQIGSKLLCCIQQFAAENESILFKNQSSMFDSERDILSPSVCNNLQKCFEEACNQLFQVFPDPKEFVEHKRQYKIRERNMQQRRAT